MKKLSQNNQLYLSILIFPLWSLYLSIKYFRLPQAKNLFWLFCVFLGFIHIFNPEGGTGADGFRYAEYLVQLNNQPIAWDTLQNSFYIDDQYLDVYVPIVTFLISSITDNSHILFLIFATVFGFFYSRNLWFVFEKCPQKVSFVLIILSVFYALICPIWNINGVRMWTALQIFVYGALPFLYDNNKSKLIWCIVSLFVHFSFFIPLFILLIYELIPKKISLFYILFIVTSFVNEIDVPGIKDVLYQYFPDFMLSRVDGYTSDAVLERVADEKLNISFHVTLAAFISQWSIFILISLVYWKGQKIIKLSKSLHNLFCFSLFLYAVSNILSSIPSGGRFIILSRMLIVAAMLLYLYIQIQRKDKWLLKSTLNLISVCILFPIIFYIRMGMDYYGISIMANPLCALFINDNVPIINILK